MVSVLAVYRIRDKCEKIRLFSIKEGGKIVCGKREEHVYFVKYVEKLKYTKGESHYLL